MQKHPEAFAKWDGQKKEKVELKKINSLEEFINDEITYLVIFDKIPLRLVKTKRISSIFKGNPPQTYAHPHYFLFFAHKILFMCIVIIIINIIFCYNKYIEVSQGLKLKT